LSRSQVRYSCRASTGNRCRRGRERSSRRHQRRCLGNLETWNLKSPLAVLVIKVAGYDPHPRAARCEPRHLPHAGVLFLRRGRGPMHGWRGRSFCKRPAKEILVRDHSIRLDDLRAAPSDLRATFGSACEWKQWVDCRPSPQRIAATAERRHPDDCRGRLMVTPLAMICGNRSTMSYSCNSFGLH
jgi:hypothetical protein